jgi:hypothetical protein
MRQYGKVAGTFWTGKTGRELKAKGPEAVIVALYLMTCPTSNMLGLYWLPKMYLEHETGLGSEGASKGLVWAIEAQFCSYDEASEVVWVKEMAAWQIDMELTGADKRIKGVQREYDALPENPFLTAFYERYAAPFRMVSCRGKQPKKVRSFKAPSKPLASQEQEQEQEQEQSGFTAFWLAWPKSDRKGGKAECWKVWTDKCLSSKAELIVSHVKAMKRASAWTKNSGEFIPAPVVYLRGDKWDGAELGQAAVASIFEGAR